MTLDIFNGGIFVYNLWYLFSLSRLFEIRMQRLLLDRFIQLGLHVVDTVPAGTGIITVILQGWLSPSCFLTASIFILQLQKFKTLDKDVMDILSQSNPRSGVSPLTGHPSRWKILSLFPIQLLLQQLECHIMHDFATQALLKILMPQVQPLSYT